MHNRTSFLRPRLLEPGVSVGLAPFSATCRSKTAVVPSVSPGSNLRHRNSLAPAHSRLHSRVRRFSENLFVPEDLRNERGYAQAFSTQTAQSPDASAGASCEEPACDFHHLVPNGGGAHRPASPREGLNAPTAGSPARYYACDPDGNIDIDLLLSSPSPPRRYPQAMQRTSDIK